MPVNDVCRTSIGFENLTMSPRPQMKQQMSGKGCASYRENKKEESKFFIA